MKKPMPNNQNGKFIYLSYSHRNEVMVFTLVERLQQEGYRVWYDTDTTTGNSHIQMVSEKVRECEIFVPLLTEGYYKSNQCHRELLQGYEAGREKTIPVFFGSLRKFKNDIPLDVKKWLGNMQALNLPMNARMDDIVREFKNDRAFDACNESLQTDAISVEECNRRGDDYRLGRGVEKDEKKAFEWYRRSA